MKMKSRNIKLKSMLDNLNSTETNNNITSVPVEDTINNCGYAAYSLDDELQLVAMLNTLKIEPQYYRSESQILQQLNELICRLGDKDPYFVAQTIVWSRCKGEGMRTINHIAAALLAPFIAGQEYAKRFYGRWNRKEDKGGCIYRPDDMLNIKEAYSVINDASLTNAMKKGFASVIESLDTYLLAKYKKSIIDIINLVHPNPMKSTAVIEDENGNKVNVIDAIMNGITITADTWEAAQSDAGQEVAAAVKRGELTEEEAEAVLKKAKAENWSALLQEGKLGTLAALRNIRNILNVCDDNTIDILCKLLSDGEKIRNGLIMPYQIDQAYEVVYNVFKDANSRKVMEALKQGYLSAIPNLKEIFKGKTAVLLDCSGSMHTQIQTGKNSYSRSSVVQKAGITAATIALATNADVVCFGSQAKFAQYDMNTPVFQLAEQLTAKDMGGTNMAAAFDILDKQYDRIILLSDYECNEGNWVSTAYKKYMRRTGANPYVYCIDGAAYGTTPLKNRGRVNYYFGYGYSMWDDIARKEFDPTMHIEKIRQIVI